MIKYKIGMFFRCYKMDYLVSKAFLKDLKNIQKSEKYHLPKINSYIRIIKQNPYELPYEKLRGQKKMTFRYEVGKEYRFIIELEENLILFKNILRRESAYQKY